MRLPPRRRLHQDAAIAQMGAEIAAGIVRSKDDQGRCQRFRFNALLFGKGAQCRLENGADLPAHGVGVVQQQVVKLLVKHPGSQGDDLLRRCQTMGRGTASIAQADRDTVTAADAEQLILILLAVFQVEAAGLCKTVTFHIRIGSFQLSPRFRPCPRQRYRAL